MSISQIQNLPIGKLRPNPLNVRTHPKKQIQALARAIDEFGFVIPIVVDENLVIQAGHARHEAGKTLGLRTVPVIVLSGLSDAKRRAFLLADNKLVERAGWDRNALALELNQLGPLLEEAGLSIDLTGFEPAEIDLLMGDLVDSEQDPLDVLPEITSFAISRQGDLWQLNDHRLLCGDARQDNAVGKLMGENKAVMAFADPPYNLAVSSIQGRGRIKHREFVAASGEMSREQYTAFLIQCLSLMAKYSIQGSIHFICMDWRHLHEILSAGETVFGAPKNLIVWVKTNSGQGSFYRSQHELILPFKNGSATHVNNFELGQHGRHRTNVWTYQGINSFGKNRLGDLRAHPTTKPVAMIADALRDCSRRGDIILDPFMGSGSTILAAERVGRRAYGLEIDPLYTDVTIRRWQRHAKRDAILAATGQTFDEVSLGRAASNTL